MVNLKQYITYHFVDQEAAPSGNHILLITRYQNQWLLVHHQQRGIEFCSGKVEQGETVKQAVVREAFEELGAVLNEDDLHYIGQYQVTEAQNRFTKDVFYAEVMHLVSQEHYFETLGPKLYGQLTDIPLEQQSFILKDDVVKKMIQYVIDKYI